MKPSLNSLDAMEQMLSSGSITLRPASHQPVGLLDRLRTVSALLGKLSEPPKEASLVFQLPDQPARCFSIASRLLVGRDAECDISLSEIPKLSRRHFEVFLEDGRHVLRDCGSRNGTTVMGEPGRIATHALRNGDLVQAGGVTFAFVLPE